MGLLRRGLLAGRPLRRCSVWGVGSERAARVEAVFAAAETQELLGQLNGVAYDAAFPRMPQETPQRAQYRLASPAQLRAVEAEAADRVRSRLQPPPFKLPRAPRTALLAQDHDIAGLQPHKLLFVDVSFGLSKKEREVVVREPDGSLRDGTHTERDRVLDALFPVPGRQAPSELPAFTGPSLARNLREDRHRHLLDLASVHLDPDDPSFIRLSKAVFEDLRQTRKWSLLYGTRHQASLLFYLCLTRGQDGYLLHLLDGGRAEEAAALVRLAALLHPALAKSLDFAFSNPLSLVQAYVRELEPRNPLKARLDLAAKQMDGQKKQATA